VRGDDGKQAENPICLALTSTSLLEHPLFTQGHHRRILFGGGGPIQSDELNYMKENK